MSEKTTRRRELPGQKPDTRGAAGEHGESGPEPTRLDMTRELADELWRRNRRAAVPLAAIGATHAAGAAAAALAFPAALIPLGIGLAGALAGALWARSRASDAAGRAHAGVAAAASAGWVAAAPVFGPGGWMTWAVWLGGYALAVPYWMRHSDPDPDTAAEREQPAPAPTPEPPPEQPDWRVTRWTSYISKHNGHLPGSRLTDVESFELGWRATVKLRRGQHWHEITARSREIASVFDLPDGRVLPEHLEDTPVHQARLTVLTHNPLQRVVHWPGPGLDPARGTFPIARAADGDTLHLRMWWPGAGACHTLIAGTTGSGKSAALNLILAEAAASDRLYPVVIDGNGGMSIPDWVQAAPAAATSYEQALDLVQWVEQVRQARAEHLRQVTWTDHKGRAKRGRPSVDPSPDMPGIVMVVDEAPNLLAPRSELLKRLAPLAQMGRKTAISVVLVTQQPSVSELGGSSVLRDMLKSGNVVGFRTAERTSGGMITDVPPPEGLHQLPQQWADGSPTQGLCYLLTRRLIRARTWLVDDPDEYADLLPGKHLDSLSASVPVPGGSGSPTSGGSSATGRPGLQVVTGHGRNEPDPDAEAHVRAALEAGVPPDAASVMENTGLTLGQAKRALSRLT